MEFRKCASPEETKQMDTQRLRKEYLVENLMQEGKINMVFTHHDRLILGGAVPGKKELKLDGGSEIKAEYLLERRELGIILISGSGAVRVDGKEYPMALKECLYIGRGVRDVILINKGTGASAEFYFASAPAHTGYPVHKMTTAEAEPQAMGSREQANERVIYKYIHPDGIKSCQLMLGFTELKTGSIWNTMPPHLHERRMEAYLYFDLPENDRVWHFMGEVDETRHLLVKNKEAVISPAWSIHSGAGTASYSFVWVMAGENQSFADMDFVKPEELR
jgi:4-deoxy-L-threo-5-hexosulose-uronate ketol-isomerase